MEFDQTAVGSEQPTGGGFPGGSPTGGEAGGGGVPSTPAATGGFDSSAEQLYEVKHRGKSLKVGLQELLNGYSRHADYTQRTQELARREGDWTTRLGQYERAIQELRGVLTDRQKLAQILQQMPQGEGGEADGDEILTRAQVEQMRQQWFQEFEQSQQQRWQAHQYKSQVESLKGQFMGDLQGVYQAASRQYPMLAKLPLFNELRLKVGTYEPQSIADAKALLANEIRELAKANGWEVTGQPMAAPPSQGIEPPGGGGLMPAEGQRYASLKDPGLKNSVIADIEQLMRASLA